MSLERLALGCLFPGFEGLTPPDWVRRRVAAGLRGVVLFARHNVRDREQLRALTAALRSERPDLLVATDEEGGDVTRLEAAEGSSYPGNLALGAVDDVALTAQVARAIARDLRDVGVDLDLAPVADVNTNPHNPVIGVRSFGSDAELVARHVAAFVRGLQDGGVAACAKHFPGHGDTSQDSHLELPTAHLDERALLPFRAAVEAGVECVMTAHIRVPELGEEPATLNPRAIGLLRELGFDGAVITDALEMQGVAARYDLGEAAVRALAAGADALCLGAEIDDSDVRLALEAILRAVGSGRLAEQRLAEAAGRVARISRAGPAVPGTVSETIGLEAARRALLVVGDPSLAASPAVVELSPEPSIAAGPAGRGLGAALRAFFPDPPGIDAPLVIVLRDAHRHEGQRRVAQEHPDAVVVETGLPHWRPDRCRAYLATHGAGRVNLEAAAEAIAGRTATEFTVS